MDHAGNLVPLAIWGLFVIVAIRRWFKRAARQKPASPPAFARTAAPPPQPAVAAAPPRRRLAPPAAPRPLVAPTPPASVRPPQVVTMAETLPAEAAAAFPALDLSLPDTPGVPSAATRRRARSIAGGPAFGSPAWAANAIIANEILGTPVGLRPGATVGVPHAF